LGSKTSLRYLLFKEPTGASDLQEDHRKYSPPGGPLVEMRILSHLNSHQLIAADRQYLSDGLCSQYDTSFHFLSGFLARSCLGRMYPNLPRLTANEVSGLNHQARKSLVPPAQ
jgi:hypothetical protein